MNRTKRIIEILNIYKNEHPEDYNEVEKLIQKLHDHGCRRLIDMEKICKY